jgi:CheY-like chemotaxis protein
MDSFFEDPSSESVLAIHPTAITSAGAAGSRVRRILVTEDNPVNQLIAQKQLERLGFDVDVAADGLEALAATERESYDLVFMDCQMPMLDGYEATRRIRERLGGQPLPVIALTAHDMASDREKCLAAGMDDYMSKPLYEDDLYEVLDRWLAA